MGEYSGDQKTLSLSEFTSAYEQPVVLAFQPTQFRVLDEPDELRQWEANLVRRVGLKFPVGALGALKKLGTCCDSACPSIPVSGDDLDSDDCDMD